MVVGQRSRKLNETAPSRYPVKQAQSTVMRDPAKAELAEPLRTADYVVACEESGLCRKVHPHIQALPRAIMMPDPSRNVWRDRVGNSGGFGSEPLAFLARITQRASDGRNGRPPAPQFCGVVTVGTILRGWVARIDTLSRRC